MDKSLVDTDILSEVLKAKNSKVVERANQYRVEFGRLVIPAIMVLEVIKGLHKQRREKEIERFRAILPGFDVVPLDA